MIQIVDMSPLMILLLNVLHVKNLHTKILLSYLTWNLNTYPKVKTCIESATFVWYRAGQYILTLELN